jgi:hypothetical protein
MALGMSKLFESIYCVTLITSPISPETFAESFMSLAGFLPVVPGIIYTPLGAAGGTMKSPQYVYHFF